jgi:hypothetical protein
MLKKILLSFVILLNVVFAAEIALPKPNLKDPFLSILNKRKSDREFNKNKKIDDKTLSNILWAAIGINRDNGRLTIPTAKDVRNLKVYVIKKDGAYLYNPDKQNLTLITNANLFQHFSSKQAFVEDANVILLYVSTDDEEYSYMHAGSAYQNVANYCAEKGVKNVVRGYFDKKPLKKELGIPKNYEIIVSQAIGY